MTAVGTHIALVLVRQPRGKGDCLFKSRSEDGGGFLRMALVLAAAVVLAAGVTLGQTAATILVQESFDNASFSSRGWYDTTGGTLSAAQAYAGNSSLECHFAVGGTACSGGTPGRHLFTETDSVYVSYYIKHSTNWVGSGKPYHPHMFNFLTNQDDAYIGPAYTHLTAMVEENAGIPMFLIQDGMNIDETRVGQDLTSVTESRAVAGCNGDSDGYGNGECYLAAPGMHWNGKAWSAGKVYFGDTPGTSTYKGDWHLVEAYFKLNSVVNGKGAQDGIVRYWYDGQLIEEHTNIVFRTGAQPSLKFNQLLYAPYIGDGSPVDQTFWIDSVTIATARSSPPPAPPPGAAPRPPTNVLIR